MIALSLALLGGGSQEANLLERIDGARAAYNKQRWPEAAKMYRDLTAKNPVNGDFWFRLAYAEHNQKHYDAAIEAYRKALELGHFDQAAVYNIACMYSMKGDVDNALSWIKRGLAMGINNAWDFREDSDLANLRNDPRFRELVGLSVPKVSREKAWQSDIDFLMRESQRLHIKIDRLTPKPVLLAEAAKLKRGVGKLRDHQILVGIMRLMVLMGDGHTLMRVPKEGSMAFHVFPIQLFKFKEGTYVVATDPAHKELYGKRLLRIGGKDIDEVYRRVAPVTPHDNEMSLMFKSPQYMVMPEVLHAQGVVDDVGPAVFTFEDGSVTLDPADFKVQGTFVQNPPAGGLPLYRKDLKSYFWFEYLPERKTVFFKFNQVYNKDDESLAAFSTRLGKFLAENPVENLVIDVRNNNGGNGLLNPPLINAIIKSKVNERGRLFCIIGRETFSATMLFTGSLSRQTPVVFVGEPTGTGPSFVGETTAIFLPYSGINCSASSLSWQSTTAQDHRKWIAPDILAEPTWSDYATGRDAALEAIFGIIDKR